MEQITLDESLDPKNEEWIIWWNARDGAVCDKCFIVKKYACPHNVSGTPFYRRKKYLRGSENKLCYTCYEEFNKRGRMTNES